MTKKILKGIIPENDSLESIFVHQPHDKLIRLVFSDRKEAIAFFKQNLPQSLVRQLDWDTLELEGAMALELL